MDDQSGGDRHDREAHLVRRMTPDSVNRRLDELTERRVREAAALPPEELDRRLRSLETAWTTERVLEANASALALLGVALAAAHDRRWLLLTGVVGGFLLQHSGARRCRSSAPSASVTGARSTRSAALSRRCAATSTEESSAGTRQSTPQRPSSPSGADSRAGSERYDASCPRRR